MKKSNYLWLASLFFGFIWAPVGAQEPLPQQSLPILQQQVERSTSKWIPFCKDLHANPELSFHEKNTSAKIANALRSLGYQVSEKIGGYGVVGVLQNGQGPTLLIRADMDALPVEEETGLPYASKVKVIDDQGQEVGVMHACGHDIHMSVLIGTADILQEMRSHWQGTLVCIAQPAEEKGGGARAMLADGLFEKFPRPDFAIALHVSPNLPAGSVGVVPGFALASVDAVDVILHGVGGHGAIPNATIDPVVLAARYILAIQTLVSREIAPIEPAVVTVGSIHGGTKHNIIPAEIHLQLTIRSYADEVRNHILSGLKRIADGIALSAGVPADKMPEVIVGDEHIPSTYNDPQLTARLESVFRQVLGKENVFREKPIMAGEDFGLYGRAEPKIPICIYWLGTVSQHDFELAKSGKKKLPGLHSSSFAPDLEPTLATGIKAMTAAALHLLQKQ